MISVNNLRAGSFFQLNNRLYQVLSSSHLKIGRGGAIIKTKIKNLNSGAITERSFRNSESVTAVIIEKRKVQYLYNNLESCFFMDQESFEQYCVAKNLIGEAKKFLKEGMSLGILTYNNQVINIDLPIKEIYTVVEAPPETRGNTVQGGSKPVIIETGAVIAVPFFIKTGDKIRVNTLDGSYVERVS